MQAGTSMAHTATDNRPTTPNQHPPINNPTKQKNKQKNNFSIKRDKESNLADYM